jgi:hypothetical protein
MKMDIVMNYETRTPTEWAKQDGLVRESKYPGERVQFHWKHAAAATLHGWNAHTYQTGAEIQLTHDQYLAALEAIDSLQPIQEALSPVIEEMSRINNKEKIKW